MGVAKKFAVAHAKEIKQAGAACVALTLRGEPSVHVRPEGSQVFTKASPSGPLGDKELRKPNFTDMPFSPVLFVDYDMTRLDWGVEAAPGFLHVWPRKKRSNECYFCLRVRVSLQWVYILDVFPLGLY